MNGEDTNAILRIVIGLVVLLLVASIVFVVYRTGKQGVSSTLDNVTALNTAMTESKYTDFDQQIVPGSQVLGCITNWANDPVSVVVDGVCFNNQADASGTITPCTDPSHRIGACSSRTGGGATYISPSGKYLGTVERATDGSNEIISVTFTLQP